MSARNKLVPQLRSRFIHTLSKCRRRGKVTNTVRRRRGTGTNSVLQQHTRWIQIFAYCSVDNTDRKICHLYTLGSISQRWTRHRNAKNKEKTN